MNKPLPGIVLNRRKMEAEQDEKMGYQDWG